VKRNPHEKATIKAAGCRTTAFCLARVGVGNRGRALASIAAGLKDSHNVDVATDEKSVFKVDPGGLLTRVAGSSRLGYSGDGGPATTANMNSSGVLAWQPS
jgi:hypothetical protein